MDYNKTLQDMIAKVLNAGGDYPSKIIVSPNVMKKMELEQPADKWKSMMVYDNIPITVDETLIGDQIHMI